VTINTIADGAQTRYTLDGSEPDSASTLYTGPFSLDRTAVVKAVSFDRKGNNSIPSSAYFRLLSNTAGHGLHVDFYVGKDWSQLPNFGAMTPSQQWNAYEFAVDREQVLGLMQKGNDAFALAFTGYLQIDKPGEYTFYSSSDDGSRLFVDGKLVVNNDGDHGVIEKSGSISLTPGKHAVRMDFYNGNGGFWLDAFYKGPDLVKQLIPADKLYLKQD
jgi:hypothetical protein